MEQERESVTTKVMCINAPGGPAFICLSPSTSPGSSGWLRFKRGTDSSITREVRLRFDDVGEEPDRKLIKISCASKLEGHFGQYLDSSRNGYLGFYASVGEEVYWKAEEVTETDDGELVFVLRDRFGHTVKAIEDGGVHYLGTQGESQPLRFVNRELKRV